MGQKKPKGGPGRIDDANTRCRHAQYDRIVRMEQPAPEEDPVEVVYEKVLIQIVDSAGKRHSDKFDLASLGTDKDREGFQNVLAAGVAALIAAKFESA